MNEIVERAAQAFVADVRSQDGKPGPWIDTERGLGEVLIGDWVDLRSAMRAAIAAMREPTEAMSAAAVDLYRRSVENPYWDEAYRAMIDAALEGGEA